MNTNSNLIIINNLINILSDDLIDRICDLLTGPNQKYLRELIELTDLKIANQISIIKKYSLSKKYKEYEKWIETNSIDIKFNYVEDWKNNKKINLIKLLIALEYLDTDTLQDNIGNQSKKTYSNGEIINDTSLSLKKCFDSEFKNFNDKFYSDLDLVRIKLINIGLDEENVKLITKQMVELIQCEVVGRKKYLSNELDKYLEKITDIVDTRLKEEKFFALVNKIRFRELVDIPEHSALKFLLHGTWSETKENFRWLTELITYINNSNPDSKEYLKSNCNISEPDINDKKFKNKVITEVAKNMSLKMELIGFIIKFIFSIGTFYKHGTYYKWYNKEFEHIKEFEKYKSKSFDENLIILVHRLTDDINIEPIQELISLIINYKNSFMTNFG